MPNEVIDSRKAFTVLWRSQKTTAEIAEIYGVRLKAVYAASKRFGLSTRNLPNPGRRGRAVTTVSGPDVNEAQARLDAAQRRLCDRRDAGAILTPPSWPLDRDVKVLRTGGQYQALNKLAADLGLPFAQVQARWHIVRVVLSACARLERKGDGRW